MFQPNAFQNDAFEEAQAGPSPITGTATFAQTATWAGAGSEKITATATASQTATFAAQGSERLTSTVAFLQGAAAWSGTVSSVLPVSATAAFSQNAAWAGVGQSVDTSVSGTASFEQGPPQVVAFTALKIIGFASRDVPAEFTQQTGITPEDLGL